MSLVQPVAPSPALPSAHGLDADRRWSAWSGVGPTQPTSVAQAAIAPKGRPGAGPTAVRMPNGNYLTIGHNVFGHFGVNASDRGSVQRFVERHAKSGDLHAHSPIFRIPGHPFDVVLEVNPRLLRSIPNIDIHPVGDRVAKSRPQAPPADITRKRFLELELIGARDSGPVGGVRVYGGQSGGVLVDPKRGTPLYMCIGASETPRSQAALDWSARLGNLAPTKWLSSPLFDASRKANVAYYVPLSTGDRGLHLIEHNRADRTVFQVFPDGTRTALE